MAEFRYNPLLDDWTIVNGARQKRPDMPKDYCAFCPGTGKVPDDYTVFKYDNDWPSMSLNPAEPDPVANAFFKTRPSYGKCEVILYSPEHNASIWDLTPEHVEVVLSGPMDRACKTKNQVHLILKTAAPRSAPPNRTSRRLCLRYLPCASGWNCCSALIIKKPENHC